RPPCARPARRPGLRSMERLRHRADPLLPVGRVPELSVVIPVYREGEAARAVIEGIASRLSMPHEILVVHDEPSDPTVPVVADVARRYPAVRPLLNTLGRGPALALRAGFAAASGTAVVVTMADASDEPGDV